MTTFDASAHPRGHAGKFSTKTNAEAPVVTLGAVPAPEDEPSKHPDWDQFRAQLVQGGATEPQARALTAAKVALEFTNQLHGRMNEAKRRGNTAAMAMSTFALQPMLKIPIPLSEAHEDPKAALDAVSNARETIRTHNSLFGPFNDGGNEPLLKATADVLDDLRDYIEPLKAA